MMDRMTFNSSNIQQAEYEAESRTLIVTFTNGKRYEYGEVPNTTWKAFKESASAGSFFHSNIRQGGFPSQQLTD
jgi:KTSC domain-containing protein